MRQSHRHQFVRGNRHKHGQKVSKQVGQLIPRYAHLFLSFRHVQESHCICGYTMQEVSSRSSTWSFDSIFFEGGGGSDAAMQPVAASWEIPLLRGAVVEISLSSY